MGAQPSASPPEAGHDEPHDPGTAARLNWLRAGVLGANDGIVSTAGIVIGVAAATTSKGAIWTAGLAGLAAGAMSMAAGEYVSVSTQRDTEKAMLDTERQELREDPEEELRELSGLYQDRGLPPELADEVALALTRKDALAAHAEVELGINVGELTSPWSAAVASMVSFSIGALIPLIAILLPAVSARVPITVVAVVIGLILTGVISARLGGAPAGRAVLRNVVGGLAAMAVTYLIGHLVGTTIS